MAAPAFVSASVNAAGTQLAITFSENISLGVGAPVITVASRIIAGVLTNLSVSGAVLTGDIVTAGLGGSVRAGENVTVTVAAGVALDSLTGLLPSVLATGQSVTNNSTHDTPTFGSHFFRHLGAGVGA